MNVRIGIDFDNTLAKYDKVFSKAAKSINLVTEDWEGTKKQLRDYIRTLNDGETVWQKLQGKVYGKFMHSAEIFPGASEFLWFCKLTNTEVFIVSHKTEFGHFDEDRINLRSVATEWMDSNGFFAKIGFGIKRENIFYADTRSEKIKKINSLKLDFFIDDLVEVFEENDFNSNTIKILFSDSIQKNESKYDGIILGSWRKITDHIFPRLPVSLIQILLSERWDFLKKAEISAIKANGNSRVYKIQTENDSFLLKIYPDLQYDERERLQVEFSGIDYLNRNGLKVPKAIEKDLKLNWGIYSWINGESILEYDEKLLDKLIEFVKELKILSRGTDESQFGLASEACISPSDIETQISRRLKILLEVDHVELADFLVNKFIPKFKSELNNLKNYYKDDYNREINQSLRILSPSDFGFHNSKLDQNGELNIFDLEYFGWDDPVKLISDLIWHPAMKLSNDLSDYWVEKTLNLFSEDKDILNRFKLFKPLIGLRWIMILLNEFVKTRVENRIYADPTKELNLYSIQMEQLEKANFLLNQIMSGEVR